MESPRHSRPNSATSNANCGCRDDGNPDIVRDYFKTEDLAAFLKRKRYNVDTGWSWVVLVGSGVSNLILSLIYTVGIFNVVFLDAFRKDRQTTAWLGAVQSSFISLMGLPAGYVNNRLGPRITTMIGALFGGVGFFLAYFADGFLFMFLTYGILVGIGNGLVYLPCVVTIGFYFKRYRNLAFCIATCTVGIGTLLMVPILKYSIDTYGWRGCMLITSGLYLQTLVVGAIMRPQTIPNELLEMEVDGRPKGYQSSASWLTASVISLASISSARPNLGEKAARKVASSSSYELRPEYLLRQKLCDGSLSQSHGNLPVSTPTDHQPLNGKLPQFAKPVKELTEVASEDCTGVDDDEVSESTTPAVHFSGTPPNWRRLFSNKKLVILNIHFFFSNAACFIGYVHFPAYFLNKGASQADITLMMILIGISNSASRLLCGILTNGIEDTVLLVYMSASGLSGIVLLLCPLISSFHVGRLMFAVTFSLYGNALSALITPVTLELCSMEELSVAYGLELFIGGLSGLVGPPLAGWLYDISGDYMLSFLLAGSLYMSGTLLLMLIPILNKSEAAQQTAAS